MVQCQYTYDANSGSLTGMVLGSDEFAPVRGAIVGNLLVIVAITAAITSAALITSRLFGLPTRKALAIFHCPSVYAVPAMALALPTVNAAVTLGELSGSADLIFVVAMAMVFTPLFLGSMVYALVIDFRCVLVPRHHPDTSPSRFRRVMRLLEAPTHWAPAIEDDRLWKYQWFIYFGDTQWRWYTLTDSVANVLVGFVSGYLSGNKAICTAQITFLLAVYSTLLIVSLVLGSMRAMFDKAFTVLMNAMGVVATVLLVLSINGVDEIRGVTPLDGYSVLVMILGGVSMVKSATDFFKGAFAIRKIYNHVTSHSAAFAGKASSSRWGDSRSTSDEHGESLEPMIVMEETFDNEIFDDDL
jgi:hypothetical protein